MSSYYPVTPRTSHIRTSSLRAYAHPAQDATLKMQQADASSSDAQAPHLSAPASQESFQSSLGSSSNGNGAAPARLQSSSSNVSQLTTYTDLTSPMSSAPTHTRAYESQYAAARPELTRRRTPEENPRGVNGGDDVAVASPMSLTSPASTATNGAKRTSSGHVKNAPSLPSTPLTATFAPGHRSRTDSISSSTSSSRAGELAASLKTRLGYAMHKVQNGWEHKDIYEVERLAAHKARHSMSHLDALRRPASGGLNGYGAGESTGYANGDYYHAAAESTRSPPSKRHSGVYSSFAPPYSSSQPTPRLQPAPDIRPTSSSQQPRNGYAHAHSHTAPSSQTNTTMMSPPRTPQTQPHNNHHHRRPPTIRTDTQTAEAERDALQALFQLGSPHASSQASRAFASQASSAQGSPLRGEFATPRRVTFARSESGSSCGLGNGGAGQRSGDEGSASGSEAGAGL